MIYLQALIHYGMHFGVIYFFALKFKHADFSVFKIYLIFLSTMLIDIDHLWATPIFQANRCSFGYHTFHSLYAFLIYILIYFLTKSSWLKLISFGLIFHLITDEVDCLMTMMKNSI
ncbi:DUF6122 family protein [Psychroflexus halocasei]|uniref:LexA-binding, inner membrane-associated hydrolase n=1 Tax=Psychroflexus halocasei TaxID=908615 RepID=A0A1H3XMY5_9FLAO|nr:DUF6122 family protein [Psychroflexus halocasei]SDZ99898.1 hypothetical protein SAMN05421540_102394 [Psychroflexus halocasei]